MEETSQQENLQEAENENQLEEEGGIRRRLRDRELLRKRKAEAEEKETNQWVFGVESQRKRSRGENKSGTKRRGRPRKTDPVLQFPLLQEEAEEVISGQILTSQIGVPTVESQQTPDVDAPAHMVVQNSLFEKLEVDSAPVPAQYSVPDVQVPVQNSYATSVPVKAQYAAPEPVQDPYAVSVPIQVSYSAPLPVKPQYSVPVPVKAPYAAPEPVQVPYAASIPVKASYMVPIPVQSPDDDPIEVQTSDDVPVQFPDPFPVQASSQDLPAAVANVASAAVPPPPQVEELYPESPDRETPEQVLIEDLGPDDEKDISPSENDRTDEGLDETPLMNTAGQNKIYSIPTLSSPSLPQEYLPGNQI
ncbi:skin secretory protein xP2 isoform X1 [Poeciliopsis prolifica]|uniref:skin secretory protein xP2-like isoform X1 n=1 Tax=Poeciliopsis prolifica TaxID=188132 RepID=UPI002413D6FE|nr:skin secretory protein xP2-like isoform X1 [Poeciliopsis prolifica]XP_054875798.1 skin secretory protein xP2 isoform X1 [Poeciliopsis prolifica]